MKLCTGRSPSNCCLIVAGTHMGASDEAKNLIRK